MINLRLHAGLVPNPRRVYIAAAVYYLGIAQYYLLTSRGVPLILNDSVDLRCFCVEVRYRFFTALKHSVHFCNFSSQLFAPDS